MKEILVTGMGVISSLGTGKEELMTAIEGRRSGVTTIRYLKTSHTEYPAGEVKLTNGEMMQMLDIPETEISTRSALMGTIAVREALAQAGISASSGRKTGSRIALISGITVGGMDMSETYYRDFLDGDDRNAYISTHDCGTCTEMIADRFGIFSMVDTISTACSSAANAILMGAELIRNGRVDTVVAGGSECLTKFHLNGFGSLMILDRELCKPFDANRNGLNLGEGAAFIVLESEEACARRGAKPLCRLSGYANACDAYHQTASSPQGYGAALSMTGAIGMAELSPADIDYINAHGTGTANNDLSEGMAIKEVFKGTVPPVSSTKAFTGHTTSAAGAIEAVISIMALLNGFVPASLNFSTPMPEIGFSPSTGSKLMSPMKHVLTNSFGFGGNDTSLIFSRL